MYWVRHLGSIVLWISKVNLYNKKPESWCKNVNMRTLAILTVIVLTAAESQFGPFAKSGGLVFKGCNKSICKSGQLRGFKCRWGKCSVICFEGGCFENSISPVKAVADSGIHVEIAQNGGKKKSRDETVPLPLYVGYNNCTTDSCVHGDLEGYNCKNGLCSLICKGDNCYHLEITD